MTGLLVLFALLLVFMVAMEIRGRVLLRRGVIHPHDCKCDTCADEPEVRS